jgi:prophage regulatory protein
MSTTDSSSENWTTRMDEELWAVQTVVAKTGLARSTIYGYVKIGLFPKQRSLGVRRVAWLASEVRAWMVSRPQAPV